MNVKFYGTQHAHPHHPFCNYWTRQGPCKMCDRFYEKYPVEEGQSADDLIAKFFPHVTKKSPRNK